MQPAPNCNWSESCTSYWHSRSCMILHVMWCICQSFSSHGSCLFHQPLKKLEHCGICRRPRSHLRQVYFVRYCLTFSNSCNAKSKKNRVDHRIFPHRFWTPAIPDSLPGSAAGAAALIYIYISMFRQQERQHLETRNGPHNIKKTHLHLVHFHPYPVHIQPLLLRQGLPQLAAMLSGIQHQPILGQVDGNPPIRNTWISWNI